jgi:hypothetical protein
MEARMSQIIGMNPTGQMDYNGTFQMNGPNQIQLSPEQISKDNLAKKSNGEFVCTEKFENREAPNSFRLYISGLWILFFILLVYLIYLILSKKKY